MLLTPRYAESMSRTIAAAIASPLALNDVQLSGNTTSGDGGGLYAEDSLAATDSEFVGNTATGDGGEHTQRGRRRSTVGCSRTTAAAGRSSIKTGDPAGGDYHLTPASRAIDEGLQSSEQNGSAATRYESLRSVSFGTWLSR